MSKEAETAWPGYWCPDCGTVDENHQPACATCGHGERQHTDGMSRGCDEYDATGPRNVRCPCREFIKNRDL